jgi:DNA-directed RNA polymerase specialized sigma24 family protein
MQFKKPIKRKIKRKKPGTGPSNVYFTDDTQNAIIEWQAVKTEEQKLKNIPLSEEQELLRHHIYKTRIHPAFDALADNLINVYGFKAAFENKDDLKGECLSFLYTVLGKYDSSRSFRAFAYFNVVARNWFTIRCKNASKRTSVMVSLDNPDAWSDSDYELIVDTRSVDSFEDYFNPKVNREQMQKIVSSVRSMLRSESHKKVLDAVIVILELTEDLDFLNKRAISLYLRDLTGLSQKEISTALSAIKKKYKTYKNIEDNGP